MKHLLTLALLVCLGTFVHAQIPSYVPTNGLVGWWPFNGNANDESGNGNHGTVNGATLAADRFGNAGKAYSFDGNFDFIVIPNSTSLNPSSISISFWSLFIDGNSGIMSKSDSSSPDNYGYSIIYNFQNQNTGIFTGWNTTGSCTYPIANDGYTFGSSNFVRRNVWQHIIVTIDNNGICHQFVNGSLTHTYNHTSLLPCSSNQSRLFFGRQWLGDPCWLNGLLDDIAIYNRALSAAEVQQLYTGQSAPAVKSASSLFNYQGLVLNSQKKPLANQSMAVRFTIADSLATYYVETQPLTTDSKGLFSTQVGKGIPVQGSMASIPWWDALPKSLKTEVDTNASGQWINLGQQPMAAVPIAMYAQRTGEGARSVFGSFDTSANIQTGNGFTVTSIGNNQFEINYSTAFSEAPILQVELVGSGTYSYKTISSQVQKFVVQVTGNPDRIQFEAKGK